MKDRLPSATAVYVAFSRAFASQDPELARACQDPYAAALLPRPLLPLLTAARSGPAAKLFASTLRTLSLGLFDHIALRTALIDSVLTPAVEEGIDQVVLLGAGFDARAHRLAALARAVVFEVDQPATQDLKRGKAEGLPVVARELRYVPCDFEHDALADALAPARFDPSRRTIWLWEGVTMYLPAPAVAHTLSAIAALSAHDSLLVLTYITPELVTAGARLGALATRMLALIAEPIRFTPRPEEMTEQLARAGFELLSDAAPTDAAPHFDVAVRRPSSLMPTERIAVAIKQRNKP